MNDRHYQKLRETAWRRKLDPREEAELRAWLEAHPEARAADWETEAALTEHLSLLSHAPVPNNFTARVLQAAERAVAERPRPSKWSELWHSLLPRAAVAALALAAGVGAYRRTTAVHHQRELGRTAESVSVVANVSSLPSPEVLQDFDAIRQLPPTPAAAADPGLIAVLPWLQ